LVPVWLVVSFLAILLLTFAETALMAKGLYGQEIKRLQAESDHYYQVAKKLKAGEEVSDKDLLPPLRLGMS
jgi:hypothetical protein